MQGGKADSIFRPNCLTIPRQKSALAQLQAILHQSDHGHQANLSTVLEDSETGRLDSEALFFCFPPASWSVE